MLNGALAVWARTTRKVRMKIAIVGTGISGLVCAHHLHPRHDVTVFEANDYVGGHTHTVDVELDGRTHAVDTGFIVYNEPNYPAFTRLLDELGVATQPIVMSFSVRDETTGLEYRADGLGGSTPNAPTWCARPSSACWSTSCASTAGPAGCSTATGRGRDAGDQAGAAAPRRPDPRRPAGPGPLRTPVRVPLSWCPWARPSGRPTRLGSPASRPSPTPASWTTTGCCACGAGRSGAPSPGGRDATSTR